MQASVIISYYKNLPNLELLLLALQQQSAVGTFEVVIAEDDNAMETADFIKTKTDSLSFSLKHVTQPDNGFQKCKILNRAVLKSSGDFLIFLDGDCIPHKKLVEEYILRKKYGRVLYGRRVMLSEKWSYKMLQEKKMKKLHFFNLLSSGSKRIEEGLYLPWLPQGWIKKNEARLLGCNMGMYKDDLIAINGFDEDYIAPGGGEDSDIEWRIQTLPHVKFYSMKFKAIVFHLWHTERFTEERGKESYRKLLQKMAAGFVICNNGINKPNDEQ